MIALDTECTGLDLRHGARPFFVTVCDEAGRITYWEWPVDPLTRKVLVAPGDVEEVVEATGFAGGGRVVCHNLKFDEAAVASLGGAAAGCWRWDLSEDTAVMAHVLESNQPKNLTDLALTWLRVDIEPWEKRLEKAVMECRRLVQQARLYRKRLGKPKKTKAKSKLSPAHLPLAEWRIAEEGLPDMPSLGGKNKPWKADYWLPRAIAREFSYPAEHPYWTVLSEYANVDSPTTVMLAKVLLAELRRRGLEKIYREKMRLPAILAGMEGRGLACCRPRIETLRLEYQEDSRALNAACVSIASSYAVANGDGSSHPYELSLPKNGVNKSLREFCYNVMNLPRHYDPKSKTGEPSINKAAVEAWTLTLDPGSKELAFVKSLARKRKRDTAITFLDSYEKFFLSRKKTLGEGWGIVYPSFNPNGTDTTRLSSSSPNAQQWSKQESECRHCQGEKCKECGFTGTDKRSLRWVVGPAPGREMWSRDATNIELRIPAYESGEPALVDLFEKPDEPPFYGMQHLLNFSIVYPDLWEKELRAVGHDKVGPHVKKKYKGDWYQYCKNGDFAIQYQCGRATADRSFHRAGSYDRLKAGQPLLEAHNQRQVAFANKHGYVETVPDRSVDPERGYPLMVVRGERGDVKPTIPLSYRTQGTAGWWMYRAMVRCHEFLERLNRGEPWQGKRWPGGYYIVLTVHDELVFDFPSGKGKGPEPWSYNKPVIDEVGRLMEKCGEDIGVPTPTGCEYHETSWAEGVTI